MEVEVEVEEAGEGRLAAWSLSTMSRNVPSFVVIQEGADDPFLSKQGYVFVPPTPRNAHMNKGQQG